MQLTQVLRANPAQEVNTPLGRIQYRRAGKAMHLTHVLLHGIGSGSGSWVYQLQAASERDDVLVLAWEAPGYGDSDKLAQLEPMANDYAKHMWSWLDALALQGIEMSRPFTLVGHSLGALMAAAAATQRPDAIHDLLFLSPARGYGQADSSTREEVLNRRLSNLDLLGPQGMAQARSAAMLSPQAPAFMREWVANIMGQIRPDGYRQAAHMLAQEDLGQYLSHLKLPMRFASGEADGITPPAGCQALSLVAHSDWQSLGPVGHACSIEASNMINTLLGFVPNTEKVVSP